MARGRGKKAEVDPKRGEAVMQQRATPPFMLTTNYISNCTLDQIDDLKIAALYFDRITIVEHRLYNVERVSRDEGVVKDIVHFVQNDFRAHTSFLASEGIIEYSDQAGSLKEALRKKMRIQSEKIISEAINVLYLEENVVRNSKGDKVRAGFAFSDPEVAAIHKAFLWPIGIGKTVELGLITQYYTTLLESMLASLLSNNTSLTASKLLNRLIKYSYEKDAIKSRRERIVQDAGVTSALAYEAIKIALPDVSMFSFEDILEIRYQLRNELERFRRDMEKMNDGLIAAQDALYVVSNAEKIVKKNIAPALEDLNKKIKRARTGILRKLFDEIRDPKSYTPLIGTLFEQVPVHIAALLSLGLISTATAWDYLREMREIKESGLYYLIGLQKRG
ncbi:MAG: hypothetical protein E6J54_27950 [Deltaproteobacteria bacterium]|nr:MAG: hypothetical protein E6J54_27950 [Deltaproteobacteria bacterium]